MMTDLFLIDKGFKDITPVQCGWEQCHPGHFFGPYVRDFYLLHYVHRGKGILVSPEGTFSVSAGEYFLIRPNEINTYYADSEDPWYYTWVGFTGTCADRFAGVPLTGKMSDPFSEIHSLYEENFPGWENMREEYTVTLIFRIMAELLARKSSSAHYARRAEAYIRSAYMQTLTVEGIAEMMSLDRRYLSRIFKKRYGVTMQEYLVSVRLEAGAGFLMKGYPIGESARLSGYSDPLNFSKMFKRKYGVSPKEYAAQKDF